MDQETFDLIENQRVKIVRGITVTVIICLIAGVFFIIGTYLTNSYYNPQRGVAPIFIGIVLFVGAVIYFFTTTSSELKTFKFFYKNEVVNGFFAKRFDNFQYEPALGFDENLIRVTGLMQLGNRYKSEDLMQGSYKDVGFARSDVVIQDHRSNGKSSYTVTYFKGRWMIFTFNKNFRSDIQVIERGFGYSKKKSTIFTKKEDRRHSFETENTEFNNMFMCLCQNDAEAFYVLTPHLMQAMMNLSRKTKGEIMFGFVNNTLHVAINNNVDAFEPHLSTPFSYENDVLPIMEEIQGITDFVDELNLDRNIFKQ